MLLSHQEQVAANGSVTSDIQLRCVRCARPIGALTAKTETRSCSGCNARMANDLGIWKALSARKRKVFLAFRRRLPGASEQPKAAVATALPITWRYRRGTHSGRNRGQWAIRARSFRYIERHLLPRIVTVARPVLRILDLGAGNGWLSYRLARQGHFPVAVDLITNNQDGLQAAEHYRQALPELFPRFQAEIDNLPFADEQFDLTIFNASFHYSENYETTMAEALRCTRPGGTVLVADHCGTAMNRAGVRMLDERRALFIRRYGFPFDDLKSREYLTDEQRLAQLEAIFCNPPGRCIDRTTGCAGSCDPGWRRYGNKRPTVTVPNLCCQGSPMIILFHPRSTKPRNCRLPLAVLALAAVLEGARSTRLSTAT